MEHLFDHIDENHNGSIDIGEFMRFLDEGEDADEEVGVRAVAGVGSTGGGGGCPCVVSLRCVAGCVTLGSVLVIVALSRACVPGECRLIPTPLLLSCSTRQAIHPHTEAGASTPPPSTAAAATAADDGARLSPPARAVLDAGPQSPIALRLRSKLRGFVQRGLVRYPVALPTPQAAAAARADTVARC